MTIGLDFIIEAGSINGNYNRTGEYHNELPIY